MWPSSHVICPKIITFVESAEYHFNYNELLLSVSNSSPVIEKVIGVVACFICEFIPCRVPVNSAACSLPHIWRGVTERETLSKPDLPHSKVSQRRIQSIIAAQLYLLQAGVVRLIGPWIIWVETVAHIQHNMWHRRGRERARAAKLTHGFSRF